jgi:hypothetical protein
MAEKFRIRLFIDPDTTNPVEVDAENPVIRVDLKKLTA